jgi:hypothetical protein
MGISGQALNHHFRWYPFKKIADEIDIRLLFQASVFSQPIKGLQRGSLDDIKQMKLYAVNTQVGYGSGGMENVRAAFPGKPEDHMGTDFDTPVLGCSDGIFETPDIVAPVDEFKGFITGRLQSVFKPDQVMPGIFL